MEFLCKQIESTSIDEIQSMANRMNALKIKSKSKNYLVVLYGIDDLITKLKSFRTEIGAANFIYNQAKLTVKENDDWYSDKLDQLKLGCSIVDRNRTKVGILKLIMRNKGWGDFGIIRKNVY